MDWTSLMEGIFLIFALISAGVIAYGGWLYMNAPERDQYRIPGANRPKTLGWRE